MVQRFFLAVAIALGALVATPASAACTVSATVPTALGTYSPNAVKAGAVPALISRAGLACPSSVLLLLSNNYVRATFKSANAVANVLKLSGPAGTVDYTASPDSGATVAFTQNGTVDYMQNNLLNLLGLLGSSNADLPFYVKPKSGVAPPVGTYSDQITINWAWYICPGIGALGACIGTVDTGTGKSVITVTLNVTAKDVTTTLTTTTTWDAANGTRNPKAIPGSRNRSSLVVSNPDIVSLDAGSLAIVVPTPNGSLVALDGDGASTGAAIQSTDGNPASSLALTYTSPASTTDDVDFSSDGGKTWAYMPTAGDTVSESAVTHIRLRPRGSMAKQSSFTVSLPFLVK